MILLSLVDKILICLKKDVNLGEPYTLGKSEPNNFIFPSSFTSFTLKTLLSCFAGFM